MKVADDVFLPRKSGYRPRVEFLRELRKVHPKIRIAFMGEEWVAVQVDQAGRARIVLTLGRRVSERRTWHKLNEMKARCRVPFSQVMADMQRMDAANDALHQAASAGAKERISEGSDRLYSHLNKGSRVSLHDAQSE